MSQLKSLKTLHRLAEASLDEVRQEIIQAEARKLKLLQELESLELGIREEEKLVELDLELKSTFTAYLKACKRRRNEISTLIKAVEKQLEDLRDTLRDKYAETKKYERVVEVRIEEERRQEEAAELNFLDQIATSKFIREMDH
jgi:flagellar export protein FliJ